MIFKERLFVWSVTFLLIFIFACQPADENKYSHDLQGEILKGYRLLHSGKEKKGKKILISACRKSGDKPTCFSALQHIGDYYYYRQMCDSALEYYYNAIQYSLNTEDIEWLLSKIRNCLFKKKEYYQFKIQVEKVLKSGVQSPRLMMMLAEANLRVGNIDTAISILDKLSKTVKDKDLLEDVFMKYIMIYEMNGDIEGALNITREALRKGINKPYIRWKLKQLKKRLKKRGY